MKEGTLKFLSLHITLTLLSWNKIHFDTPKYKVVQRRQVSTDMATAACETVVVLKDFEVTVARVLNWSS